MQWNTGYYEGIHGYANGISTTEGGMHVEGFKTALTTVVNKYARAKNLLKEKDENLHGEDIREGLTAIVSVRLREPQFEGQTKAKLGNVAMRSLVQRATNERLAEWLEENPTEANGIVEKAHRRGAGPRGGEEGARRHPPQDRARRAPACPTSSRTARSSDPGESELFIVEGDSAGGSAVDARDPRTQAILPIRGKILNVERARIDKMLKNTEIQALITAIGGGVGDEFDVAKVRYDKVIVLADADVDGSHIRTLLLTFFFRQMTPLVEAGYVYIAQPPLYSTEVGKEKVYLKDDAAKAAFLAEHPNHKKEFQRLKGLGEMDWRRAARDHHGRRPAHAAAGRRRGGRGRRRDHERPDGRRRRGAASTSSPPTPRTSASSTSDDRHPDAPTDDDDRQPTPTPPLGPIAADRRSRTRWSARSSTTRCPSSCRRALPDVRDGLKPVHRRILWDMDEQGFRPDRPFVKCARVTGDVMAKLPPARRLARSTTRSCAWPSRSRCATR